MKTYSSQSTIKPVEWDVTSSPTAVYHNYNVKVTTNDDGTTMYIYDVDKMTFQEYTLWLSNTVQEQQELIDTLVFDKLTAEGAIL